ncbi:hypothetical protein Tco_1379951 [Tanacetum coccineum]
MAGDGVAIYYDGIRRLKRRPQDPGDGVRSSRLKRNPKKIRGLMASQLTSDVVANPKRNARVVPLVGYATSQSWKSILQGLEVLKDEMIFFLGNCHLDQALNYYLWLRSRKVWVGRIMLGKLDPLSLLSVIPLKVIWMKLALGPPLG